MKVLKMTFVLLLTLSFTSAKMINYDSNLFLSQSQEPEEQEEENEELAA